MGLVVSGCVQCRTYCHDRCLEWRWNDNDDMVYEERRDAQGNVEYYASSSRAHFGRKNKRSNGLTQAARPVNYSDYQYQNSKQKTSSIFVAIRDKNTQEVLRHLAEDETADVRSTLNSNSESPLHLACRLGYIGIADLLVDKGCRGDVTTRHGTPIHCLLKAIKSAYVSSTLGLDFLPKLLAAGCNIDGLNDKEETALYQAICHSNEEFIEGLIARGALTAIQESGNGFTALHMAAFIGDISCLSALLKAEDVAIDVVDCQGRSALVISLLNLLEWVQREPSPNLLYSTDTSYLEPASQSRGQRVAIVEALLIAGADPNVTDSHGRNPMLIAHGLLALDMTKYGSAMGYIMISKCCSDSNDPNPSDSRRESMFAPMVRLLVMFGGRFPIGHQQTSFMRYADWMQKLYEDSLGVPPESSNQCYSPRNLVHICRLSIRSHLGQVSTLHRISELPLPEKLLNYVLVTYM